MNKKLIVLLFFIVLVFGIFSFNQFQISKIFAQANGPSIVWFGFLDPGPDTTPDINGQATTTTGSVASVQVQIDSSIKGTNVCYAL